MSWERPAPSIVEPDGDIYGGNPNLANELKDANFVETVINRCLMNWSSNKPAFIEEVEMLELVLRGNAPFKDMDDALRDVENAFKVVKSSYPEGTRIPLTEQAKYARDKFAVLYKLAQKMKIQKETF